MGDHLCHVGIINWLGNRIEGIYEIHLCECRALCGLQDV